MKKEMIRTLVTVSLIIASTAIVVVAQNRPLVKAEIPFAFTVGNKQLPAGSYTVAKPVASTHMILIRSAKGNDAAYAITNAREGRKVSDQTKLVFRRYGNQYFLSQMWTAGEISGTQFPVSRAERKLLKGGDRNLAQLETQADEIVVVVQ